MAAVCPTELTSTSFDFLPDLPSEQTLEIGIDDEFFYSLLHVDDFAEGQLVCICLDEPLGFVDFFLHIFLSSFAKRIQQSLRHFGKSRCTA